MKIKKGDFVELDYIAKVKELERVFDLTNEKQAKEYGIYNEKLEYKPIIICVGFKDVIEGLDEFLIGKEEKEYTVEIPPEKAFGKKNPQLIKLIPTSILKKQKIIPISGLQINIDGLLGTVITTGSGRTTIDFNSPLAGKIIIYEIKINRIVKDDNEKINSFLRLYLTKNPDFEFKQNKLTINTKKIHDKIKEELIQQIKKRIPSVRIVNFKETTTRE